MVGGDGAQSGDLAGLLVVAEQRGQRNPDLDTDPLVVVHLARCPCVCAAGARVVPEDGRDAGMGRAGAALPAVDVVAFDRGRVAAFDTRVVGRPVGDQVSDDLIAAQVVQGAVEEPDEHVDPDLVQR